MENVEADGTDAMQVGAELEVQARINLGRLSPDDVRGAALPRHHRQRGRHSAARHRRDGHERPDQSGTTWLFKGNIRCRTSGHYGYAVRVLPRHARLGNPVRAGPGLLGITLSEDLGEPCQCPFHALVASR